MDEAKISKEANDLTYTKISLFFFDGRFQPDDSLRFDLNSIIVCKRRISLKPSPQPLKDSMRVYVLSNHLLAPEAAEGSKAKAAYGLEAGEHLKVLANPSYQGKAGLILLHLPEKLWSEFRKDTSLIDTLLINYATREFEFQCEQESGSPAKETSAGHSIADVFELAADRQKTD